MTVYSVSVDVNRFQTFIPEDPGVWRRGVLRLDCTPLLSHWTPPDVYVHNPTREQGDFFHLCPGGIVVEAQAAERVRNLLEMAGELLPFKHKQRQYYLLNILECVNCLDVENTDWVVDSQSRARIRIKQYQFHRRFSESTLFKIPETSRGEILCVAGIKNCDDEFKCQVETLGLTGLIFRHIWSGID